MEGRKLFALNLAFKKVFKIIAFGIDTAETWIFRTNDKITITFNAIVGLFMAPPPIQIGISRILAFLRLDGREFLNSDDHLTTTFTVKEFTKWSQAINASHVSIAIYFKNAITISSFPMDIPKVSLTLSPTVENLKTLAYNDPQTLGTLDALTLYQTEVF